MCGGGAGHHAAPACRQAASVNQSKLFARIGGKSATSNPWIHGAQIWLLPVTSTRIEMRPMELIPWMPNPKSRVLLLCYPGRAGRNYHSSLELRFMLGTPRGTEQSSRGGPAAQSRNRSAWCARGSEWHYGPRHKPNAHSQCLNHSPGSIPLDWDGARLYVAHARL